MKVFLLSFAMFLHSIDSTTHNGKDFVYNFFIRELSIAPASRVPDVRFCYECISANIPESNRILLAQTLNIGYIIE